MGWLRPLTGTGRMADRLVLLTPLPRRARLRLWCTGRVDTAAYWLVCHRHYTAAQRLWQLCGMW